MKLSARNQLKGTITSLNKGAVNCEVTVELPCGQVVVSIITNSAAESLSLQEGMSVAAVIKASSVMIGIE